MRSLCSIPVMVLLAACGDSPVLGGGSCIAGINYAVIVELYDQDADTLLLAGGRGVIRDGDFTDSLKSTIRNQDGDIVGYVAGLGRPGTYDLTVERDGFRAVERRGIVAHGNRCGVITTQVRVDMEQE